MSKNVALFVDVANLYYSARGQDVDVDYVALLKSATKGRDLIRAYAYSGLDPENENQRKFIDFLNKNGYKVLTKDIRKFGDGRVKANLDIELVVDLFRLADRMDIAVIVSGDGDFAPAIKALQDQGVRCEVISFRPNTSSDLIAVADEFIDIMKIAGIGRGSKEARAQRGMSAPEMPAKEVVPEFGFREASPHVAQAALAALREGRAETPARSNGSGRGRGRGRAAAATSLEPADGQADETAATTVAEDGSIAAEGEARKRRRRRGGRGRGRRARGVEAGTPAEAEAAGELGEPAAPGEAGEIGWVELDDLSQLGDLEGVGVEGVEDLDVDRQYSFEDADEATLAELGLGPEAATAGDTEAAPAEEKKTARRRTTRKKAEPVEADAVAADAVAADADGDSGATAKKPARRRTTRKAASAASEAEDKPKRPRRTTGATTGRSRKTAGAAAESSESADGAGAAGTSRRRTTRKAAASEGEQEGSETEGIWQRFRSARGSTRSS